MKKRFENFGLRMQQMMVGRYGNDELSQALSVAGLVCLVLSWITGGDLFYGLALGFLIYATFRSMSRKIEKRSAERSAYLRMAAPVRNWLALTKKRWSERKTHRYFKCEQCGAVLRVPKGKGKIELSCPQCHCRMIRKS